MKEAERRIWVIRERPPEPQKPLPPQPFPSPPVSSEGDGALCEEVTGECMWASPHSARNVLYRVIGESSPPSVRKNVLSECVGGGCTVNLIG